MANIFFLRSPLLSYAKIFVASFVLPIIFISVLATILPKRKTNLQLEVSEDKVIPSHGGASLRTPKLATGYAKSSIPPIGEIEKAIRTNKLSEMHVLRIEELGDDIISQETFIPQIKKMLLVNLQRLMTLDDWRSWKDNMNSPYVSRTNARIFVDNVSTVNFYLGRYLETAGLLFSALYNSTINHGVFNIEESLYHLLEESNALFANKKPSAISSRVFIDTLITEDVVFDEYIQNMRTDLVISIINKRDRDLDANFMLLSSIPTRYIGQKITDKYVQLIDKVTNSVSPRLREDIRTHYFYPDISKELQEVNEVFAVAINNLYLACIQHHVDTNQISRARSLYLQLASFSKNNVILDSIKSSIDTASKEAANEVAHASRVIIESNDKESLPKTLFSDQYQQSFASRSSLEWYSFFAALTIFIAIIFKTSRNIILNSIVWISTFIVSKIKRSSIDKSESLSDELHESIKAGKTVPMSDIAKQRATHLKKAVNS